MAIKSPNPISLRDLLRGKKFEVPIYQRPFSWTKEEADELWNDLIKNSAPYFLGILVFQQKTDNTNLYNVVDGQQRLATLILLIRAAVEILNEVDSATSNKLQDTYINQMEWDDTKPAFTLKLSERDKSNFLTLIGLPSVPTKHPSYMKKPIRFKSPAKLISVKNLFKDRLTELLKNEGVAGVKSFISDKVLGTEFINIILQYDDDVYQLFETLNARGIDLTIADLLKNKVCDIATNKDEATRMIDEITNIVGIGKINSFLLHYAIAQTDKDEIPTKKYLMRWYSETIEYEKELFIHKLKEFAEVYSLFVDPKKNTNQKLKEILTFLNILGASRCYPLLLVGYDKLDKKDFITLCQAVEVLTFRHSTIAGKDAKILEQSYFEMIKLLKVSKDNFSDVINRIKNQSNEVSDSVFRANLLEYDPANNLVAKYILYKIECYISGEALKLEWSSNLTLEHILAPGGAEWEGKEKLEDRLGNNILLSEKMNKSVGTKPYKIKKEEYKKEIKVELTKYVVATYPEFTKDEIVKFQEYLTEFAVKIWKL